MAIITGIILLASVLLVFVVYIQNPKGGGLSSDFGAAQQLGGVQKTNDFIDKATWGLAALVGIGSIVLTLMSKSDIITTTVETPTEQGPPTDGGGTPPQ
jgi:preprotein translocase subunit SecG